MIIVINNQRMYEKSYQQSKSSNCLFYKTHTKNSHRYAIQLRTQNLFEKTYQI